MGHLPHVHSLLTLLYPERQLDMIRTIVDMSRSGNPPTWELVGEEVQMMVGDPFPIVIAESLKKGVVDFECKSCLKSCINPLLLSPGNSRLS